MSKDVRVLDVAASIEPAGNLIVAAAVRSLEDPRHFSSVWVWQEAASGQPAQSAFPLLDDFAGGLGLIADSLGVSVYCHTHECILRARKTQASSHWSVDTLYTVPHSSERIVASQIAVAGGTQFVAFLLAPDDASQDEATAPGLYVLEVRSGKVTIQRLLEDFPLSGRQLDPLLFALDGRIQLASYLKEAAHGPDSAAGTTRASHWVFFERSWQTGEPWRRRDLPIRQHLADKALSIATTTTVTGASHATALTYGERLFRLTVGPSADLEPIEGPTGFPRVECPQSASAQTIDGKTLLAWIDYSSAFDPAAMVQRLFEEPAWMNNVVKVGWLTNAQGKLIVTSVQAATGPDARYDAVCIARSDTSTALIWAGWPHLGRDPRDRGASQQIFFARLRFDLQ